MHPDSLRVFLLFFGTTWLSNFATGYLARSIGGSKSESTLTSLDLIQFGIALIPGLTISLIVSNYMEWTSVQASAWQYFKAAAGLCVAIPAALWTGFAMLMILPFVPGDVESWTFRGGALAAFFLASLVIPLLLCNSLRILSGGWDWMIGGAILLVWSWSLYASEPWKGFVFSFLGGLSGLWLLRAPQGS